MSHDVLGNNIIRYHTVAGGTIWLENLECWVGTATGEEKFGDEGRKC